MEDKKDSKPDSLAERLNRIKEQMIKDQEKNKKDDDILEEGEEPNNNPQDINDILRIDTNGGLIPMFKIRVPIASPYIIVGLASSFALSLKTTIMAEIITGDTGPGLGNAIRAYRSLDPTDLSPVFAISVIAIVIVLIVDLIGLLINRYIENRR